MLLQPSRRPSSRQRLPLSLSMKVPLSSVVRRVTKSYCVSVVARSVLEKSGNLSVRSASASHLWDQSTTQFVLEYQNLKTLVSTDESSIGMASAIKFNNSLN